MTITYRLLREIHGNRSAFYFFIDNRYAGWRTRAEIIDELRRRLCAVMNQ